jgi:hypothetical protein
MLVRRIDHIARAVDVGGEDVFGLVEGQRRRRMDDDLNALHGLIDLRPIPDVALDLGDLRAFGIIEVGDVQRRDFMPTRQQVARQVDTQKTRAAGDEKRFLLCQCSPLMGYRDEG